MMVILKVTVYFNDDHSNVSDNECNNHNEFDL